MEIKHESCSLTNWLTCSIQIVNSRVPGVIIYSAITFMILFLRATRNWATRNFAIGTEEPFWKARQKRAVLAYYFTTPTTNGLSWYFVVNSLLDNQKRKIISNIIILKIPPPARQCDSISTRSEPSSEPRLFPNPKMKISIRVNLSSRNWVWKEVSRHKSWV